MKFIGRNLTVLALCLLGTSCSSGAKDMKIYFGNNAWTGLVQIETTPTGKDAWETMPIEVDVINPGDFVELLFPNGEAICTYDMRFTKAEGEVVERPAVDLCAETYYHFSE